MVLMLLWVWAWAIVGISSMNGHVPYVSSTKCLYIFVRHMTMQNRRSILWNCLRVCGNQTTAIHLAHQHKKHAHTLFTIHFTLSFFHSKFSLCFFPFIRCLSFSLTLSCSFFILNNAVRYKHHHHHRRQERHSFHHSQNEQSVGWKCHWPIFKVWAWAWVWVRDKFDHFRPNFFPLDKNGLRFECEWRTFGLRSIRMLSVRFSSLPSLYSDAIGSLGCLLFNCDFY